MKGLKVKGIIALLLTAVMLFSLCSCKSKEEDETVPSSSETVTSLNTTLPDSTASTETTDSSESTETTLTTTAAQSETQTQAPEVTEPATQSGEEPVTQVVAPTGTETVVDGNKTIFYPAALKTDSSKYPVIAWANGTACNTELYYGLLKAFSNAGYIVIADSDVMAGDGKSLTDSIDYMINKNSDSSSAFYNKVNTNAIGVFGHSQGGKGCIFAAKNDSRIRCLVSFAGSSTADEARGITIPCLFLTGTSDYVVVSSQWVKPSYDAVSGRAVYASLKAGIHTTCMTSPHKVTGYAISWFDAYLKNDSNAKKVFEDGGKLSQDALWQDFESKN